MSLLEILTLIPDKRRKQGQKYQLAYVLFYSILAILSGAVSYAGIHRVITIKLKLLNKIFGTKWERAPGVSTLFYIFDNLDIEALEKAFRHHSRHLIDKTGLKEPKGLSLAIDGKALKGSNIEDKNLHNILSVFTTQKRIILAHMDVKGKGNELKGLQELLANLPDLKNSTITTDALHTQKKQSSKSE